MLRHFYILSLVLTLSLNLVPRPCFAVGPNPEPAPEKKPEAGKVPEKPKPDPTEEDPNETPPLAELPTVGIAGVDAQANLFNAVMGKADPFIMGGLFILAAERIKKGLSLALSFSDRSKAVLEKRVAEEIRAEALRYKSAVQTVMNDKPEILAAQATARAEYQPKYADFYQSVQMLKHAIEANGIVNHTAAQTQMLKDGQEAVDKFGIFGKTDFIDAWLAKYDKFGESRGAITDEILINYMDTLQAETKARAVLIDRTNAAISQIDKNMPVSAGVGNKFLEDGLDPGHFYFRGIGLTNGIRVTQADMTQMAQGMDMVCIEAVANLNTHYGAMWMKSKNIFQWGRMVRPWVITSYSAGVFGALGYGFYNYRSKGGQDLAKEIAQKKHTDEVNKTMRIQSEAKLYPYLLKRVNDKNGIKNFVEIIRETIKAKGNRDMLRSQIEMQYAREFGKGHVEGAQMDRAMKTLNDDAQLDAIILAAIADANENSKLDLNYDQLAKFLSVSASSPAMETDLRNFLTAVYGSSVDKLFPKASGTRRSGINKEPANVSASRLVEDDTYGILLSETLEKLKTLKMDYKKDLPPHKKIPEIPTAPVNDKDKANGNTKNDKPNGPAGVMGANGGIRVGIPGQLANNAVDTALKISPPAEEKIKESDRKRPGSMGPG